MLSPFLVGLPLVEGAVKIITCYIWLILQVLLAGLEAIRVAKLHVILESVVQTIGRTVFVPWAQT